jgi:hypothetical protein
MDSIDDIKSKLQQLEHIKEIRRKAVQKYYNKWIKGSGEELSDEEQVLHQHRKEIHRVRAQKYYYANKKRISERDKVKYQENKQKNKVITEKSKSSN